MAQPVDQLVHAQLAVVSAHRSAVPRGISVLAVVAFIVQVEVHRGVHTASDSGLDESADPHARGRIDARVKDDLRARIVDNVEPVEDVPRLGVAAADEITNPAGVVSEVQVHCGPDTAVQLREEEREDLEGLAEVKPDVKLGHVEREQIHVLAQQQFDCRSRVGEER